MGRVYDIKLKCGCLVSEDGGGGAIPCYSDDEEFCKECWEEYLKRRKK